MSKRLTDRISPRLWTLLFTGLLALQLSWPICCRLFAHKAENGLFFCAPQTGNTANSYTEFWTPLLQNAPIQNASSIEPCAFWYISMAVILTGLMLSLKSVWTMHKAALRA